jgi:hypothetical protein
MKIPPLRDWKICRLVYYYQCFWAACCSPLSDYAFALITEANKLLSLHCIIFQKILIFISTTVRNSYVEYMQIPICTCLYTFRDTQLPSFKPCPPTTVLSPDITYHLFREAVNIPVIASLSGPWSTTWMQLQTRMQINNLFLLAGHTVRFFYPCNHKPEQVQSYEVLHIIKQYLHWPRLLQVIFC